MGDVAVVKQIYDCYGAKDIEGITSRCTEDFEWMHLPCSGTDGTVPWFVPKKAYAGKSELPAIFQTLAEVIDYNRFNVVSITGSDGQVTAYIDEELVIKSTGKNVPLHTLHLWEVTPEGKAAKWQCFSDTHALLEAFKAD